VYDTGGNIQNRFEYAYTLDELELDMGIEPMVPPLDTVYYGYMEGTDVLIRYDGKRIESSLTGIYNYDGWTYMTDHGTRLMEMWNDETGEERYFTYNADGMRTKRTEPNGTTYHYVYNGGSLSQMTVGSNTLYFTYDANGAPLTVTYNGTTYYYATNLQGDVTAILNNAGTAVVSYTYDAWGNILDTAGTMKDTLGTLNPLRYRGYVYDIETNLYYLQSRYYNPKWGRFISADAYISTGQGILGHNMFAYCLNNPVMFADPSGNCAGAVIGALIALGPLVFSAPPNLTTFAVISGLSRLSEGYSSNEDLSNQQTHWNATIIYNYLTNQGWSHNAICATLGNLHYESATINPGKTQNGGPAFGIAQWDPASKYTTWASNNGFSKNSLMGQLNYLVYSMQPGQGEWFDNDKGCYMSYSDFISSNAPISVLTEVFMWSYERPSVLALEQRISHAEYWGNYFR